MCDLVFLKLGGSAITDKTRPEALDEPVLRRIAAVVAATMQARPAPRLLIGHGGGSFGHHWANLYQTHMGVHDAQGWEGVVRVQDAMSRLCREVVRYLLDAGVPAMSIQPSASAITVSRSLAGMSVDPIVYLLNAGVVPVLHGDVALDRAQGAAIISTETVFAYLAPILRPRRIVLVGEHAVFTADPHRSAEAVRIPVVDDSNIEAVLGQAGASHGVDVTGGMASKVAAMWKLVLAVPGLDVQLVGPDPVAVAWALRGDVSSVGTIIRRAAPHLGPSGAGTSGIYETGSTT